MEGCGDGRVADNLREAVKEKDAGKEMTTTRMPEMEGAIPVQDVKVNMGDVDVETMEAVIEGVAQGVTGRKRRGGSSSNIAKHLKRAGRFCKVDAARFSPYTTP